MPPRTSCLLACRTAGLYCAISGSVGPTPRWSKRLKPHASAISASGRKPSRPPRDSNKLRRAEDADIAASRRLEATEAELDAFEERVARERAALHARLEADRENARKRREQRERARKEVAGDAYPPAFTGSQPAADAAGIRNARDSIDEDIGPELLACLDQLEDGSAVHQRLAGALARLEDVTVALGNSVEPRAGAAGPCTDHMAEEDDGEDSDSDGMSSVVTADGTVPEPADREPSFPPEPGAAAGGCMVDSTKRGAPSVEGMAQWQPTGKGSHGQGAWRRGATRGEDDEDRPHARRRTDPRGDHMEDQLADEERAAKQRQIEEHIQQLQQQHALLAQHQQQRAAACADPASAAAAQAQSMLEQQQLAATAAVVSAERHRLRLEEVRKQATVNGVVIPSDLERYPWEQLQSWAAASLLGAPLQ